MSYGPLGRRICRSDSSGVRVSTERRHRKRKGELDTSESRRVEVSQGTRVEDQEYNMVG